jgi:hypothetical protein
MFRQVVSPFVCILIALVVCVMTFVGTATYSSQKEEQHLNQLREEWSKYTKYNMFNDVSDEDLKRIDKLIYLIELIDKESIRDYEKQHVWDMIYKSLGSACSVRVKV